MSIKKFFSQFSRKDYIIFPSSSPFNISAFIIFWTSEDCIISSKFTWGIGTGIETEVVLQTHVFEVHQVVYYSDFIFANDFSINYKLLNNIGVFIYKKITKIKYRIYIILSTQSILYLIFIF